MPQERSGKCAELLGSEMRRHGAAFNVLPDDLQHEFGDQLLLVTQHQRQQAVENDRELSIEGCHVHAAARLVKRTEERLLLGVPGQGLEVRVRALKH